MITDYLWRPVVEVDEGELAFLVHPGSRLPAEPLGAGWRWHWPIISTIRTVSRDPWSVAFADSVDDDQIINQAIEPIVCITRDHHLFTIGGRVEIQLHDESDGLALAAMSAKVFRRQAQSWVRQALRSVLAEYQSKQLESPSHAQLQQRLIRELNFVLQDWALESAACAITLIEPYALRLKKTEMAKFQ